MPHAIPAAQPKRLNFFERYLSLWVLVCMVVGVALGSPDFIAALSRLEFGEGSQVNVPCRPHLADDLPDDAED